MIVSQAVTVGDQLPRSARLRLNKAACGTRKPKKPHTEVRVCWRGVLYRCTVGFVKVQEHSHCRRVHTPTVERVRPRKIARAHPFLTCAHTHIVEVLTYHVVEFARTHIAEVRAHPRVCQRRL
eukprot:364920-Chlamydomonas_euryale.AAC.2